MTQRSASEFSPVSGSVSCPELTSTARCAFAFSNRPKRFCKNPAQNVRERNCVSASSVFSSVFDLLLINHLFKMAYRKLQVAFSWHFELLRKNDVCGKHIVTFRPQNILSSPKRASTESELKNTTRSELCKTNESHESKYDHTYLCTHI